MTSCLADGLDQPSAGWLGHDAAVTEISQSGLWNIEHIRQHHEPGFLDLLNQLIHQQRLLHNSSPESGLCGCSWSRRPAGQGRMAVWVWRRVFSWALPVSHQDRAEHFRGSC